MKAVESGGFDPVHDGHLDLTEGAWKRRPDQLVVILNSNEFLTRKKGRPFYPSSRTRYRLMRAVALGILVDTDPEYEHIRNRVDVRFCIDKDDTVCKSLTLLKLENPDDDLEFYNGGDRDEKKAVPETEVCEQLGIKMLFNVGGNTKGGSSSELQRNNEERSTRHV